MMREIWLVVKHEVRTTLQKRSFWIFALLMPAVLLAFQVYFIVRDSDLDSDQETADSGNTEESGAKMLPIGLVDDSGLISEIPAGVPDDMFVSYHNKNSALRALEDGDIEQVVHIPPDYLTHGDVTIYDQNFQLLSGGEGMGVAFGSADEWILGYLLNVNLIGDEQLVSRLMNPLPAVLIEQQAIIEAPATDEEDQALAETVARAIPYIYYFILIVLSGYILQSVTAEKENRTVEVLLLSLRPRQLMIGKILGLGLVALLQLAIWMGAGMLILGEGSEIFRLADYAFPPGFAIWAALYLVLGYLLYASLMAAAGAIAPSAREGGQVTYLLILPFMPTLMFGSVFAENPNGMMPLVLSLFPLSAPSAMVTRLAVSDVPLWQMIVGLGGLVITTYGVVLLSARFFRPQNLLSQSSFSWRRLATGWKER